MGAKTSAEMIRARKLITEQGCTAYQAARATGLTVGAISRTQWYKSHVAGLPATDDSTMTRARALVEEQGLTAYAAAKTLGIAQSTISRAPWYKTFTRGK